MNIQENALYYVKDENGTKVKAGIITFTERGDETIMKISAIKSDHLFEVISSQPEGGYIITDAFSGGRIEVVTTDMQVRFVAIAGAIDMIREKFDLPMIAPREREVLTIAVKPNPAKS